jgi:hypothetical protein
MQLVLRAYGPIQTEACFGHRAAVQTLAGSVSIRMKSLFAGKKKWKFCVVLVPSAKYFEPQNERED